MRLTEKLDWKALMVGYCICMVHLRGKLSTLMDKSDTHLSIRTASYPYERTLNWRTPIHVSLWCVWFVKKIKAIQERQINIQPSPESHRLNWQLKPRIRIMRGIWWLAIIFYIITGSSNVEFSSQSMHFRKLSYGKKTWCALIIETLKSENIRICFKAWSDTIFKCK
jgi:hypothetical protein